MKKEKKFSLKYQGARCIIIFCKKGDRKKLYGPILFLSKTGTFPHLSLFFHFLERPANFLVSAKRCIWNIMQVTKIGAGGNGNKRGLSSHTFLISKVFTLRRRIKMVQSVIFVLHQNLPTELPYNKKIICIHDFLRACSEWPRTIQIQGITFVLSTFCF